MVRKKYLFIFFLLLLFVAAFFWIFYYKPIPFINGKIDFSWLKPKKESQKPFAFSVAGDNHNNIEVYLELIQKVNNTDAAFLVDLGDTTRIGGASEYAETKSILAGLKIPYHMVIGNHDIVGDGYDIWREYFGPTYYSWDYEDTHFIVLDDVTDPNAFSEEQLSWLENDLQSTQKELKFIFVHTPPRCPSVSKEELGFTGPKSEERINQCLLILNKYKVNKIYAGHIHNYLNYSIDGIPITVTGGAGGPIYNIPIIGRDSYHYINVEVFGSNFQQKVVEL